MLNLYVESSPIKAQNTFWMETISDVTDTLASNISRNSTKNSPKALRDPICKNDIDAEAVKINGPIINHYFIHLYAFHNFHL